MSFECYHCGQCCENVTVQINVTLGDVLRLSEFLNKPAKEIIPAYVDINPFGDPDSDSYELDLGLNIPCGFREGNCTAYEARPLNCRFFPFWLIGKMPLEQLKESAEDHACLLKSSFTLDDKEKCKGYMRSLSQIFQRESELTEEMLDSILPKRTVFLKDFKGFGQLKTRLHGMKTREAEALKIEWIREQLPKHKELAKLVEEYIRKNIGMLTSLSRITAIEEKTKPF